VRVNVWIMVGLGAEQLAVLVKEGFLQQYLVLVLPISSFIVFRRRK
jgi:hypothetical protein